MAVNKRVKAYVESVHEYPLSEELRLARQPSASTRSSKGARFTGRPARTTLRLA